MQTGLIFYCESRNLQLRVDIADDVTISFDEVTTPLCDARQIEIPAEIWPEFAAAVTALLARRDAAIAAEVQDDVQR